MHFWCEEEEKNMTRLREKFHHISAYFIVLSQIKRLSKYFEWTGDCQ